MTICELFESTTAKYPDKPYLLDKTKGKYRALTYQETHREVYRFAAGLMAMGLQKGDRAALLAEGSSRWVIAELGVMYCGAINVPLSVKLTEASDIIFRTRHAGVKFFIVSPSQYRKLDGLKDELPELEKVILLGEAEPGHPKDVLYYEVMAAGDEFLRNHRQRFESRWKSVQANDYANICYTSGTTADPKGIILTHRNYTANTEQSLSLMDVPPEFTTLLILPWDHAFAHTCGIYTLMKAGASMAAVESGPSPLETIKNIPINIKDTRPHFLLSVPALAKNFRKNIEKGIETKGAIATTLFRWGLAVAYAYNGNGWNRGKGPRCLLKPFTVFFDKILFSKVREAFGGRLQFFVGGGALLDIELQKFFYAIGLPMLQGYGLTEAAPVISANSLKKHKMGSSGILVNNIELKIADEQGNPLAIGQKGEIVVRGENVMAGYWNNPEATAESLRNGWLHTGDLGYLDKDGFLYVLGRFKSLLIADDGEKYSPEGIEEALQAHSPLIEQCILYNNQNAYTVALIVPSREGIRKLKAHHSQANADGLLDYLWADIQSFRKGGANFGAFPDRWLPASFALLTEGFTEDNGLMNSTMKVVRPKIVERYKPLIDNMYTPDGKAYRNKDNKAIMEAYL